MSNREIEKLADKAKEELRLLSALDNSSLYTQKLLKAFPLERDPKCEYFDREPFGYWKDGIYIVGRDAEDYSIVRKIFDEKEWNQVNFDVLLESGVSNLYLNENGLRYYLPGFLAYYYDLRRFESMYASNYFPSMSDFADGYVHARYRIGADGRSYLVPIDFSAFEKFTLDQSKLLAAFLVHVATLSPSKYEAEEAQRALTSYWGKFLMI
jgi:hypothetical protein